MFDTPQERIVSQENGISIKKIDVLQNHPHLRTMLILESVHELEMKPQEIKRIK